jgi:GcrA cell cycle regulator
MNQPWTEEREAVVRKLWAKGWSASEIASELGGTTRNAVIGKVSRLKLGPHATQGAWTRVRIARPEPVRFRAGGPWEPLPGQTPVPLLDVTAGMCRWPLGVPGTASFGFCGCEAKQGSPYCPAHHARAYTGVPGRKPVKERVTA